MKFYKATRYIVLAVMILAFAGMPEGLFAQAGRGKGRLRGIVKNPAGDPVVNAKVQIIFHGDQNIKHNTTTNDNGRFSVNGLSGGNWQIFVSAEGYKDAQMTQDIKQVPDNPWAQIFMKKPAPEVIAKNQLSGDATLIEKGKQLHAEANYDEAIEVFNEFLTKQPDFYQTHILIGNVYKDKGELDAAMASFKKALEIAPTDGTDIPVIAQANSAIGDLYIRKNDLDTAQKFFQKSLNLNPKDEILAYNVGEIFFANAKTDEAIKYFQLALSIKPNWALPYQKIGYAYLNSADYKNAIAAFNKFLELDPQSDEAATIQELITSLKDMK